MHCRLSKMCFPFLFYSFAVSCGLFASAPSKTTIMAQTDANEAAVSRFLFWSCAVSKPGCQVGGGCTLAVTLRVVELIAALPQDAAALPSSAPWERGQEQRAGWVSSPSRAEPGQVLLWPLAQPQRGCSPKHLGQPHLAAPACSSQVKLMCCQGSPGAALTRTKGHPQWVREGTNTQGSAINPAQLWSVCRKFQGTSVGHSSCWR